MNKLETALASLNSDRPALMTHVVIGYPSIEESVSIVRAMSAAGAAIIELQIPFSDPMADGPTIMRANEEALAQGVTPELCLEVMKELSGSIPTPLLFMSYANILLRYKRKGLETFCREAADAGCSGLIVPDIPLEESDEGYWTFSKEVGLQPVSLVSPVTDDDRLAKICALASGFLYCVATTGTTGARAELPEHLVEYLEKVRRHSPLPRAVGFGISSRAHIESLRGHAEMAIVGSAMINCIRESAPEERLERVTAFTKALLGAS